MKLMNRYISLAMAFIAFIAVHAQVPVPGEPQAEPILLKGATIHVGNGQVIENGYLAFEEGKITAVGSGTISDEGKYDVRNLNGKHIYPGFIMPNSQVGIQEVSSVNAMSDYDETGQFNPNVRSQIAYNTDSEVIPTYRFNGILMVESTPTGGLISGTSSVMQLDAWNWEDATVAVDVAMHMNWPGRQRRSFDWNTYTVSYGPNPQYNDIIAAIKKMMQEAKAYSELKNKEKNLKLAAMQGLFDGSQILVIHTDDAKGVIDGVSFAKEMGVQKIAVASDTQLRYITEFLVDHKIPVVLPPVHATPSQQDDDYDLPYKLAKELAEAGVQVSLGHNGMLANGRNLPFYAGTVVAHGLDKEEALKLITSNTAKMLGVYDRMGSLEKGKDATLFVSEGDALDMRTNSLSHAFIGGREVQLDARQQALYKKFSDKYEH